MSIKLSDLNPGEVINVSNFDLYVDNLLMTSTVSKEWLAQYEKRLKKRETETLTDEIVSEIYDMKKSGYDIIRNKKSDYEGNYI